MPDNDRAPPMASNARTTHYIYCGHLSFARGHGIQTPSLESANWGEYYRLYSLSGKCRISSDESPVFCRRQSRHVSGPHPGCRSERLDPKTDDRQCPAGAFCRSLNSINYSPTNELRNIYLFTMWWLQGLK